MDRAPLLLALGATLAGRGPAPNRGAPAGPEGRAPAAASAHAPALRRLRGAR